MQNVDKFYVRKKDAGNLGKHYSVIIDFSKSDPSGMISYTDDVDCAPMSLDWFDILGLKLCVLKDGKVLYYLNPNNVTKQINGAAADITTLGNDVMLEIPRMGTNCMWINQDKLKITITTAPNRAGYDYRAFSLHKYNDCDKMKRTTMIKTRIIKCMVLIALMTAMPFVGHAQKFALIDMEYVLKNIPAYERANEQLNQASKKWQAEVEALNTEASTMYKNYQNELVFLSKEQKKAKQEAIMQKEKEAADLKQKYFAPEGELFKKRESLMQPIQEEIYNAVKEISDLRGYSLVLDRSSDTAIIFGSPRIDISDEVLKKLGYSAR